MEESVWYFAIIISLIFSAFFSGMEIAFITSNKLSIELEGKHREGYRARILAFFNKRPSRFIGSMLLGNNTALVIFGIGMAKLLERPIALNITSNSGLVLLIQTIISTLIVLAFAEFLPKTIFRINPNRILNLAAYPLIVIYVILWVPMILTIGLSERILKAVFKADFSANDQAFGRIDLDHYVKDSTERAKDKEELDHEIHIFQNALDFKDVKARDCMIPRTEIIALDVDDDISELQEIFTKTGLSKVLIYRDSVDNIIGYTHSYELFKHPESIKSILLPIGVVPESRSGQEILGDLTRQKRSIAVVVDEFGGTAGIVTIEDIVEEIFGEIEDEHDSEELIENQIDEKTYLLSARHEIDHLNQDLNFNIPEGEDYDTLAGYILHRTETIPAQGEVIETDDFVIEIEEVSHTKIETVKFTLKEAE